MSEILDEKDFAIIDELKKNSKLSEKKLAKKTNIPMTTIHNRIKKLRESGIIEAFTIRLNYKKLGKPLVAFVFLKTGHADQREALNQVLAIPQVQEAAMITGEFDILFRARTGSMEELNKIIVQNLRKKENIEETRTIICYDLVEKL